MLIIVLYTILYIPIKKVRWSTMRPSQNELIIVKDVDLRIYPQVDDEHPSDVKNQLTMGDCHANALKAIHFLIRQNVLNLGEEDFELVKDIFDKPTAELTQDDLLRFIEALSDATVNPVGMVRFLGDILADRGPNDFFILKMLEILHQKEVPLELLISNHDIEFIASRESKDMFESVMLHGSHMHSMLQMQMLIDKDLITRDEVLDMFDDHYKPNLKVISYSLNVEANLITLFSHAPVDYRVIQALVNKINTVSKTLCLKYQILFQNQTAEALAKTIDSINEMFAYYTQNNLVHTLYDNKIMHDGYSGVFIDFKKNPFEFLMWNRFFKFTNFQLNFAKKHPKGYNVAYVYGHTIGKTRNNVFPLDNSLGKNYAEYEGLDCIYYERNYTGKYHILFSQDIPGALPPSEIRSEADFA